MQDFGNFDEGGQDAEWSALSTNQQPADDLFGAIQMNAQPASVSQNNTQVEDDLTEEERQMVSEVAAKDDERRQMLHAKVLEESKLKNERRVAGTKAIETWKEERKAQINLRKQNNQELERQYNTALTEERQGNPWHRVVENCDFSVSASSQGGKDKSRMKEAMLNRKGDKIDASVVGQAAAQSMSGFSGF